MLRWRRARVSCKRFFPEGGLSRDGNLRAPKLGLLSYMVQGFDPEEGRDVVFIPVGGEL